MSSGRRGRRPEKRKVEDKDRWTDTDKSGDGEEENPSEIVKAFKCFQTTLDSKHDKHERLVKLSRDVTIESKRTIFLLHRITGHEDKKEEILKEALEKLQVLQQTKWKTIALELHKEDPYLYLRAYSAGLQEYVEALSFHYFLQSGSLISLKQVEETLIFPAAEKGPANQESGECEEGDTSEKTGDDAPSVDCSIHIPPMEYMLGLADLTGELMRMAINSVGNGNLELPFQLCSFLRVIHDAFVSYGNVAREINRKTSVLRQSLQKVETACYTLKVRGSEIPKNMLADIFSAPSNDPTTGGRYEDSAVMLDG